MWPVVSDAPAAQMCMHVNTTRAESTSPVLVLIPSVHDHNKEGESRDRSHRSALI